ncbi:hypothetical protein GCM10020358_44610 [Amorphoplanes nipponensis]
MAPEGVKTLRGGGGGEEGGGGGGGREAGSSGKREWGGEHKGGISCIKQGAVWGGRERRRKNGGHKAGIGGKGDDMRAEYAPALGAAVMVGCWLCRAAAEGQDGQWRMCAPNALGRCRPPLLRKQQGGGTRGRVQCEHYRWSEGSTRGEWSG